MQRDHEPVLCSETVDLLCGAGPGLFVDATLGAGGHAAALLARDDGIRLIGIDRDSDALALARTRLAPFGDRVFFCRATSSISPPCSQRTPVKA